VQSWSFCFAGAIAPRIIQALGRSFLESEDTAICRRLSELLILLEHDGLQGADEVNINVRREVTNQLRYFGIRLEALAEENSPVFLKLLILDQHDQNIVFEPSNFAHPFFNTDHIATWVNLLQESPDPRVRANAAWFLGVLGENRIITDSAEIALIRATGDPDETVRRQAERALARIQNPIHELHLPEETEHQLTQLLLSDNPIRVRELAARHLARLSDRSLRILADVIVDNSNPLQLQLTVLDALESQRDNESSTAELTRIREITYTQFQELGITAFPEQRFSSYNLNELRTLSHDSYVFSIGDIERTTNDSRPLALAFVARCDTENGPNSNVTNIRSLIRHGYQVVVHESTNRSDINNLARQYGYLKDIAHTYVQSHGYEDGARTTFRRDNGEEEIFTLADVEELGRGFPFEINELPVLESRNRTEIPTRISIMRNILIRNHFITGSNEVGSGFSREFERYTRLSLCSTIFRWSKCSNLNTLVSSHLSES